MALLSPTRRRSSHQLGDVALAVTVVTWAAAFPAIRVGLDDYSPWALGLLRLLIASVVLGIVGLCLRRTGLLAALPGRGHWPRIVLCGLVGQTLYQGLLMVGEVTVPAGTASLLIATAPIFSVTAASLLLGERVGARWIGMLVAFSGAVLVGRSLGGGGGWAALTVVAAAGCQGLYLVIVKPLAQSLGALAATAWSLWVGMVLALPAMPTLLSEIRTASPSATAAAAFLGLVPSAIGYLTWSVAVARTSVARSSATLYLVPVVATALAWLWLREVPAPLAVVGGALAVLGVVLVRRMPSKSRVRCVEQGRPTRVAAQSAGELARGYESK